MRQRTAYPTRTLLPRGNPATRRACCVQLIRTLRRCRHALRRPTLHGTDARHRVLGEGCGVDVDTVTLGLGNTAPRYSAQDGTGGSQRGGERGTGVDLYSIYVEFARI